MRTARVSESKKTLAASKIEHIGAGNPKQILVMNSCEEDKEEIKDALDGNYELVFVSSGDEAISVIDNSEELIWLILLDQCRGGENSYTFIKRCKMHEVIRYIPILMMVDSYDEEEEIKALESGASGIVSKPIMPDVLRRHIENVIKSQESMSVINFMAYDQLTGLYTKEYFFHKIDAVLANNPEKRFDIVCGDIEKFKLINDVFGFSEGDRILKEVASDMRCLAGKDGVCSRLGSDTFAALIEHREDLGEEECIYAINRLNEKALPTNVSLKFSVYHIDDLSVPVTQMCDRAVLAVQSIKNKYGEVFTEYDDSIRLRLIMEQTLVEDMDSALENKQFVVYYQPKYNIHNDKIAGAEALVRWQHPEKGLLYPGAFIPLFERNGSIFHLDCYVWEEACAQIRKWKDMGITCTPISANVSRTDLYKNDLPQVLSGIIEKYGLEPKDLHLEITESAYTDNPRQIIDVVTNLHERGFVIEMDDFGTGYSSLNMLSELPIDVLKLDIAFIQSESESTSYKNIFSFIVSLAKWLDLLVIAEGVETKEQIEKIRRMDCDFVQGYYFCRPIPADEFCSLLGESELDSSGKLEGQTNSATGREAAFDHEYQPRNTILIVDDSVKNRNNLKKILEPYYMVMEADNGASALKILKNHGKEIAVAVIDPSAPVMDGCKLLSVMKNDERLKDIPVIMMSRPDKFSEEKALMIGADDYIGRPFKQILVLHRVQNTIDSSTLRMQQRFSESRKKLMQNAYTDYLTGLLNWYGLVEAWSNMPETCLDLYAYFLIDIDDFKEYNDTFGYDAGDEILKTFAKTIQDNLRADDLFARTGNDEFVVITPDVSSAENALKRAEHLCEIAAVPCSIGVEVFEKKPQLIENIGMKAEKAMHRAKQAGKKRCCIGSED